MVHALSHFRRSFVGEGDGQDRIGLHPDVLNQMDDPVGNHAGLAAPGARQDQYRTMHGFGSFALLRIEFVEKIHSLLNSICCRRSVTLRTLAVFAEVVPGIDAALMSVVPLEMNRVLAYGIG